MNKRGQILIENVVFIILNLIFITILILFVMLKSGSEATFEDKYSKQIALMIDSAKPEMIIVLNMEDAIKKAEKNNWGKNNIVSIEGNMVTVKLRDGKGASYPFFNDVNLDDPYTIKDKEYRIKIGSYK
jgi:hypothetical protein